MVKRNFVYHGRFRFPDAGLDTIFELRRRYKELNVL